MARKRFSKRFSKDGVVEIRQSATSSRWSDAVYLGVTRTGWHAVMVTASSGGCRRLVVLERRIRAREVLAP